MIQRIQSIYFFVAALFSAGGFMFPVFIVTGIKPGTDPVIAGKEAMPYSLTNIDVLGLPAIIVAVLAIVAPLVAIFLYKNRPLQMRIGRICVLVTTAALALLVMRFGEAGKMPGAESVSPSIGMFLPVVSIVLLLLAVRAVKKDEALVRSADRIR